MSCERRLAERVGFVPDDLAPINGLGLIRSRSETAKSTQNLSIRYKTGTAILRCLPPLALQRLVQIPVGLQPHPELRRRLQESRQPQRRIGRDAALPEDDFVQPVERDAQPLGGLDLPQPERLQVLLQQDLSWRNRRDRASSGSLVIILDADFEGMAVLPPKRHPVLIVHANAVTLGLLALQALQAVTRRNQQGHQGERLPSRSLSFRWTTRQSSRGIRLAARVLRSLNRSAVVVVRERLNHAELHVTRLPCKCPLLGRARPRALAQNAEGGEASAIYLTR